MIILFNLKSPGKRVEHEITASKDLGSDEVLRSIGQLLGPPLVNGNLVSTLHNGDEIFPAMLKAIGDAKKTITFETFIYWSGEIGQTFSDALAERARAGVKVHVLLDWVGSRDFDGSLLLKMKRAGVEVERYRPLRWYNLMKVNNRTHRKILVIDGKLGFTGGVGIADQWMGHSQDKDHWRDSHFKVEGPVVLQLQAAFVDNWHATNPEVLHGDDYFPDLKAVGDSKAQVFKSSPEEGSGSVRLMYLFSIAHAKESILIANAYFVPDTHVSAQLIKAVKRGVKVEVILPGRKIDTKVTRHASRAVWGELLKAGVKIYEFEPTMFHCKYTIVDKLWVSVGSTNLDNRSFRLNDECNLNVIDEKWAASMIEDFGRDRLRSREVTFEEWSHRPFHEKTIDWFSRHLRSQV